MFRASSRQSSGAQQLQWQPLVYCWSVVVAVLLVVVGSDRPDHDQQHCYHHAPTVKLEAATAVVAPDDGREDSRNMLSRI
jgi:hypothetical protein